MRARQTLFALFPALLAASAAPALADRATAAAAIPPDDSTPFLSVYVRPSTSGRFDDLPRLPEYLVYPSGTFLVQKSDHRLWAGRLSPEETVDLMDFLMTDAGVPGIDMRYLISSPLTDFTEYTLRTRTGSWSPRRRASGGVGPGVASGEAALKRVDTRLFSMADRADTPYDPGLLYVVSEDEDPDEDVPNWAWNEVAPFAALVGATHVGKGDGAVLVAPAAPAVATAVSQGPVWKFAGRAARLRARPALPHEIPFPRWNGTTFLPADAPPPAGDPTAGGPAPDAVPGPPPPPTRVPAGDSIPGPAPIPPPPVAPPTVPAAPAAPTAAPTSPAAAGDDLDYAGVQALLRGLKAKVTGAPHGKFWEKPYEEFVTFQFEMSSEDAKVPLLESGKGASSNLVRALRGQPLLVVFADGTPKEVPVDRMPPSGPGMPEDDILRIERWIDRGAPKEARPTALPPVSAPESLPSPMAPPPPAPPPPPPAVPPAVPPAAPPSPPPTVVVVRGSVPIHAVGDGQVPLGRAVPAEDGNVGPALFVARTPGDWLAIFDVALPRRGPAGAAVARSLAAVRDVGAGYDFASSDLILLVGPATDNYVMQVPGHLEVLPDGSARFGVGHRHEARAYVRAPDLHVRWAAFRTSAKLPTRVSVIAPPR